MNQDLIKESLHKAPFGYACLKVVYDNHNTPFDLEIIETNTLFETISGNISLSPRGRKISEVLPDFFDSEEQKRKILADAAICKENHEFSSQIIISNQKYRAQAWSTNKNQIALLLTPFEEDDIFITEQDILHKIIEHNPLPVMITNSDGFVSIVNPSYVRLFKTVPPKNYNIFSDKQMLAQGLNKEVLSQNKNIRIAPFIYNPHNENCNFPYIPIQLGIAAHSVMKDIGNDMHYMITFEAVDSGNISQNNPVADANIQGLDKVLNNPKNEEEATILLQTKEELVLSKQSYLDIYNTVTEAIYIQDINGVFVDVNKGAEKMYGYSREELIGKDPSSVTAPGCNDIEEISVRLQNVYLTGITDQFEFWGMRKNGEVFPKDVIVNKGKYFGKEVLITTARDITDQKSGEKLLKKSLQRNEAILKANPDIMFLFSADGTITDYNANNNEQLYVQPEFFLNKNVSEVLPSGIAELTLEKIKHVLSTKKQDYAKYDLNMQGAIRFYESRYAACGNNEVIAIVRDITDIKNAEDALRTSEEKFRTLIENANDIIYTISPEGIFTYVSPNWTSILGHETSDVKGKSFEQFIHPDDLLNCLNAFQQVITKEQKISGIEYRVKHKNGEWRWHTSNGAQVKDANGNIIDYVGIARDITSAKQTEEKLTKERILLRTLIDNLPDNIFVKDTEGRKLLANIADIRFCKKNSEEEVLGKTDVEIFAGESGIKGLNEDLNVIQTGIPMLDNEEIFYDHNNNMRWFRISKVPLFDNKGKIIGLVGIGHDQTDLKFSIEALKRSEEKFRLLATNATDVIWTMDLNARFLYISPSVYKLRGYTPEEAVQLTLEETLTPESVELTKSLFIKTKEEIASGKKPKPENIVLELEEICKDGSTIRTEVAIKGVLDENNNLIYIIGNTRNISRRKKAEEALKESEERLQTLINSTPDIICFKDGEGRWLIANNARIELFSLSNVDYKGKTDAELAEFTIPALREALLANIKSDDIAWEKRTLTSNDISITKHDGTTKTYHVIKVPLFENDGSRKGLIILGRDITERKHAEMELIHAKERAEENERLKSAFLANMSHEIRTPMNGILGFLSLLQEPDISGDEKDEFINIIKKSGERLINTINDIIDISKIEAGQMKLNIKETNVNHQISDLFAFFKPEAEKKKIKLILNNQLSETQAYIKTDPDKLIAIFTNLIKNALKFTDEGSIEIGCHINNDLLEMYVKDTGIGIAEDRSKSVFERFIQADNSRTRPYEGSGLGLSISKAYVEMMHGNIWLDTEYGKGSTFYFHIPYTPVENIVIEVKHEKTESIVSDHKLVSILITEDDEVNYSFLELILKKSDYVVHHAETGAEAVDFIRDNPQTSLILMDMRLPDMNGYTVTKMIREFNMQIPIIALTAFALEGDREKAIDAGCNDYLSKPVDKDILMNMISRYTEKII